MKLSNLSAVVLIATIGFADVAEAQMPLPRPNTPTLFGAQRLDPGDFVLGFSTGYPKTSFNLFFGLHEAFDLGLLVGITYGDGSLGGNRQRLGMDVHVPLRWTMATRGKVALGLRISPYFMIGESRPSISFGGDLAFLIDIPLPKLFKIIVGPEVRTGFNTNSNGRDIYDGGAWANIGIETNFLQIFYAGVIFQGGGFWGAGSGVGSSANGGLFRANVFFGAEL